MVGNYTKFYSSELMETYLSMSGRCSTSASPLSLLESKEKVGKRVRVPLT